MRTERLDYSTKRRWAIRFAGFYVGLVKSGFAIGGGLLVVPTLAMVVSAKESLAIVLPLLGLADVVNLALFWNKWHLGIALLPLPGAVLGVILATKLLAAMPDYWVRKTIGALGLMFVPLQVARMTLWSDVTAASFDTSWIVGMGLVTGLIAGVFSTIGHLGGVATTIYFLLVLPREGINESLVGTATMLYIWINIMKFIMYYRTKILTRELLRQIPAILPILVVGLAVGKAVNVLLGGERVDWFIYIVLGIVTLMAIKMIFWSPRPTTASDGPAR